MFVLYLVKLATIFTAYSTASNMKSPQKVQCYGTQKKWKDFGLWWVRCHQTISITWTISCMTCDIKLQIVRNKRDKNVLKIVSTSKQFEIPADYLNITLCLKKTSHFVIFHIFAKYWLIFKILLLAHCAMHDNVWCKAVCVDAANRYHLMGDDVINYDVTSATNSYVFVENVHFTYI